MSNSTIGQVADRSGFSASALRYYEDLGLLAPASRTASGYRLYDDRVLDRLSFIARAKQLGCRLDEITDLVAVWDGEQCGPVQRRLHALVTDKLRGTHTQIAELNAFADQLQGAAARLDGPAVDGPCSSECACLEEDEASAPVAVMLGRIASIEQPIACTLQPDAVPQRIGRWWEALTQVRARRQTPDDRLRVELQPHADLGELATLVAAEQQCCPFFAFTITVDDRGLALEIGSPAEAADIVGAIFGAAP